jgi:hypothetical protein
MLILYDPAFAARVRDWHTLRSDLEVEAFVIVDEFTTRNGPAVIPAHTMLAEVFSILEDWGWLEGLSMYEIIAVGVYLLLGVTIAVGIAAVFQKRSVEEPISHGHSANLGPLAALATIAEEAHRHSPPDLNPLPWTPPSSLGPVGDNSPKAIPTLVELSERLGVLEARLDQIAHARETSINRSSETVRMS